MIRDEQVIKKRLVCTCDWVPLDFGEAGQYAMMFAPCGGEGSLEIIRYIAPLMRDKVAGTACLWIIVSNLLFLKAAFGCMRRTDTVLFTGSPPLLLHVIAPEPDHRDEAHSPHHGLSPRVSHRRARAEGFSAKFAPQLIYI